jgi:hypothetical protein
MRRSQKTTPFQSNVFARLAGSRCMALNSLAEEAAVIKGASQLL